MTDAMLPLPALSPVCGKTVVAKFEGCETFRQVPKRIMLGIEDTLHAVHGGQQLRLFNAHTTNMVFSRSIRWRGRFITASKRKRRNHATAANGAERVNPLPNVG
jgi:hypothetical protein